MGRQGLLGLALIAVSACAMASALPSAAQDTPPKPEAPGGEAASSAAAGGEQGRGGPSAAGPDEPTIVKVGALINDIQELNLQAHSYTVDMYIWFRWDDPEIDPSRSFEFMNPFELWGHIISYETGEPRQLPDGSYLQVVRNQGKFNAKLPLERYPFDTQHLVMELEDTGSNSGKQIYVPDDNPVALSDNLVIPGWELGEPTLSVVDNSYETNFGDPRSGDQTFSRVIVDLAVTRPYATYALKLLLPMLLVALTAILALMVHPEFVEGRIGIGITALLTLVALQLTSNSSLPEVDYLILLDKLYILSYGFVVLTMAMIVKNSWIDAEGDVKAAIRVDRRAIIVLTVLYFGLAGLIFLQSLT